MRQVETIQQARAELGHADRQAIADIWHISSLPANDPYILKEKLHNAMHIVWLTGGLPMADALSLTPTHPLAACRKQPGGGGWPSLFPTGKSFFEEVSHG